MKKNNKHQLPVIIGSGLSGLAISYLLNKKKNTPYFSWQTSIK